MAGCQQHSIQPPHRNKRLDCSLSDSKQEGFMTCQSSFCDQVTSAASHRFNMSNNSDPSHISTPFLIHRDSKKQGDSSSVKEEVLSAGANLQDQCLETGGPDNCLLSAQICHHGMSQIYLLRKCLRLWKRHIIFWPLWVLSPIGPLPSQSLHELLLDSNISCGLGLR